MVFIFYFIVLIVLRSTPALSVPTENPSSSADPAGYEQIDHTHFLSNDISNLYLNEKFSDVVLVVDNKRFHAHRAVLASRSDYFGALLYNGHIETYNKDVPIKEGSPTSFKVLLEYIYFGRINLSILKSNIILELLILSNVWRFENLQFSLSEYLCNNIDVHIVSSLFSVALFYQLKELEDASINFIDIHTLDVLQSKDSLSLSAEALQLILNRDTAYANELDIFRAVCHWIKKNQDNLAPDDKINILSAVRYQLMDKEELFEVRGSELVRSDRNILDVIKKSLTQTLNDRGRLEPNVNFAQENSIEVSQIDGGTMIMLDHPSNINYIEMNLCDVYSCTYSYYIDVSVDRLDWLRVINHSNYDCRSIQRLWINRIYVKYIRVVGTKNTSNKTFKFLKVMYNTDKMHLVEIKNGLVAPRFNVALSSMNATLIKGIPNSYTIQRSTWPHWANNNILNDEYKNYGYSAKYRGYTFHYLESECIEVQLAQPYVLSSMRMLLWDYYSRTYGYTVEVSVNNVEWDVIADKSNKSARSWQLLQFDQRPVAYIRITGIRTSNDDRSFRIVYLEAPAQVSLDSKITKQWQSLRRLLSRK
ncbi:BTB/POZ domain-containing protein 9-like isoform X1 [Adelges cooleyi]|uniref:BTB/POZ domain-containing protein 9-like isoform X1 n=1 Tax=Adelges cooleyi TaxID=133065 RepID=UPI00217F6304|nr:BTB/POZ domain-containing protein 9-like isoform X1 [Adelges cooleyi]